MTHFILVFGWFFWMTHAVHGTYLSILYRETGKEFHMWLIQLLLFIWWTFILSVTAGQL